MTNKKSNKISTTKPSVTKKKQEAPKWLLDNIAEASKNARKIYFLFMGFLIYCGLTVVGISDRQIILNDTVSLPILRMDVPLNGFFILSPVITIFVFFYFQLYLTMRKDLINKLKIDHPEIKRENLYPWMLIVLDYPKKGFIGRLQSAVVKFSVWCLAPVVLMLISSWFVKKHDPTLSYIIGLTPICGIIIVFWFWFRYENIKFKIRQIPQFILNNLGKNILIFFVIIYEIIFLFFIIPSANEGFYQIPIIIDKEELSFKKRVIYSLKSFFCVDLSYQKLIIEPEKDYPGSYWLNFNKVHLEGARLISTILERSDLRGARLQNADMDSAILQGADLQGANLQGAILTSANLQDTNLEGANLQEAFLQYAYLQRSYLYTANLKGASLVGANLQLAALGATDLRGAWLSGADLQKTNLSGANLQGARLTGANFQGAVLFNANLKGASLVGANLRDTALGDSTEKGIESSIEQLSGVRTLYEAKLDPELLKQIKEKYPHLLERPKPKEEHEDYD